MARGKKVRRILVLLPFLAGCANVQAPGQEAAVESLFLSRVREVMARVPETLAKNHKVFVVPDGTIRGFGAGEAYPQIWLRDSAWIVKAASAYYDADSLLSWLDLHLKVAEKNGRLRDWVAAASPEAFREWAPRVLSIGPVAVDTNSNESDQEPSAALAYCRIVDALRGQAAVMGAAHASRVARLVGAMDALARDRTDARTGLIWSGLTADWGDVSPLYPDQRAIYLDAKTPRTLSLYSNVMAYAALDCLASLDGPAAVQESLRLRATKLKDRIRSAFWMRDRGFFRIRLPLDPTPDAFKDDGDRFALGGNALAALFGVADDPQADSIFENAERLRALNHFSTISTTLIPPYAAGVFLHPAMREPFRYQNGGAWDWFGAALVQAEFERGYSEQARVHLDQIAARVLKAGAGLHEWYARDGSPGGSASYASSAAAIHNAVLGGLLGVSGSSDGLRVVLRTGETLARFQIPQRAPRRLEVRQTVSRDAMDVEVSSSAPVREVCSVLPPGRIAAEADKLEGQQTRSTRRVGLDTVVCAAVSGAGSPIRVRFALHP